MLSIDLGADGAGQTVYIAMNDDGIRRLSQALDALLAQEGADPVVLTTPSHGSGNAILTEDAWADSIQVHKVIMDYNRVEDTARDGLLLSFEVQKSQEDFLVVARVNQMGIMHLKDLLDWLLALKEPDHTHSMTPAWGGPGLTEDASPEGNQVHHVKMMKW